VRLFISVSALSLMSLIVVVSLNTNGKAPDRPYPVRGRDVPRPGPARGPDGRPNLEFECRELVLLKELDSYLSGSGALWSKKDKDDVVDTLLQIETQYGYRPRLFLKMMRIESNFQIKAVSRDGAMGLCQIQPGTARSLSFMMGSPPLPSEL